MKKFLGSLLAAMVWAATSVGAAPLSGGFGSAFVFPGPGTTGQWEVVTNSAVDGNVTNADVLGGIGSANSTNVTNDITNFLATYSGGAFAGSTSFANVGSQLLTAIGGGSGSFIFQAFDRTSGNAGDTIAFDADGQPAANGFAYFFDLGSNTELGVLPFGDVAESASFGLGSGTDFLVGFGSFGDTGGLNVANVAQMPELNPASAALPLALAFLAFAFVSDRRRREVEVAA